MHYVAEWMHSITGKRALNLRAVCTKLSVFTLLLCFGYNINKLHSKIQNDRLGSYLFPLKTA